MFQCKNTQSFLQRKNDQNKSPQVQSPQEESVPGRTDIDIIGWANNVKVPIPLVEVVNFPTFKTQIAKLLGFKATDSSKSAPDMTEDPPIIISTTWTKARKNQLHESFFISLVLTKWIFHNYMLDSGASTNLMTLKVAKRMGLTLLRPYRNICALDSHEIQAVGLITDLEIHLAVNPDVFVNMDVFVKDVSIAKGMLASRKWVVDVEGTIHMGFSYATSPTPYGETTTLRREPMRRDHVEDLRKLGNEVVFLKGSFRLYTMWAAEESIGQTLPRYDNHSSNRCKKKKFFFFFFCF
jgi:hypothetical protein